MAGKREHLGEIVGKGRWEAILNEKTRGALRKQFANPERRSAHQGRSYPLRGVLVCGECGRMLASDAKGKPSRRMYGCRVRSDKSNTGCGKVYVQADHVEDYVYRTIQRLADDPRMINLVEADAGSQADEARRLVEAKTAAQERLAEWADMFTAGDVDRQTFTAQSRKLREEIDRVDACLASMRSNTLLDKLGGQVAEAWDGLSSEDKRAVILAIVQCIEVNRKKSGNSFDPERLHFRFVIPAVAKLVDLRVAFGSDKRAVTEGRPRKPGSFRLYPVGAATR